VKDSEQKAQLTEREADALDVKIATNWVLRKKRRDIKATAPAPASEGGGGGRAQSVQKKREGAEEGYSNGVNLRGQRGENIIGPFVSPPDSPKKKESPAQESTSVGKEGKAPMSSSPRKAIKKVVELSVQKGWSLRLGKFTTQRQPHKTQKAGPKEWRAWFFAMPKNGASRRKKGGIQKQKKKKSVIPRREVDELGYWIRIKLFAHGT